MGQASVFVNGRFVEPGQASVSAFDTAFQHSVGLFETLLGGVDGAGEPSAECLGDHLARLARSASELGLSMSLRTEPLGEAVLETIKRSGLARARVRLTVTGGQLSMLGGDGSTGSDRGGSPSSGGGSEQGGKGGEGGVVIVAQPATEYPAELYEEGIVVTVADSRANPLNETEGHKTVNYWWRLRELQKAARKGGGEAIVLQVTNHICGGCVSNLFARHGDELVTPIARGEEETVAGGGGAMRSPVLPGITRMRVIDEAEQLGVKVVKRMMSISDVLDADEVFLTNSSWSVLPVKQVEGKGLEPLSEKSLARTLQRSLSKG